MTLFAEKIDLPPEELGNKSSLLKRVQNTLTRAVNFLATIPTIKSFCLNDGETHDPGEFADELQEVANLQIKDEITEDAQKRMATGVSIRLDYIKEDEASGILLFWSVINRMPILAWSVKQNSWKDRKTGELIDRTKYGSEKNLVSLILTASAEITSLPQHMGKIDVPGNTPGVGGQRTITATYQFEDWTQDAKFNLGFISNFQSNMSIYDIIHRLQLRAIEKFGQTPRLTFTKDTSPMASPKTSKNKVPKMENSGGDPKQKFTIIRIQSTHYNDGTSILNQLFPGGSLEVFEGLKLSLSKSKRVAQQVQKSKLEASELESEGNNLIIVVSKLNVPSFYRPQSYIGLHGIQKVRQLRMKELAINLGTGNIALAINFSECVDVEQIAGKIQQKGKNSTFMELATKAIKGTYTNVTGLSDLLTVYSRLSSQFSGKTVGQHAESQRDERIEIAFFDLCDSSEFRDTIMEKWFAAMSVLGEHENLSMFSNEVVTFLHQAHAEAISIADEDDGDKKVEETSSTPSEDLKPKEREELLAKIASLEQEVAQLKLTVESVLKHFEVAEGAAEEAVKEFTKAVEKDGENTINATSSGQPHKKRNSTVAAQFSPETVKALNKALQYNPTQDTILMNSSQPPPLSAPPDEASLRPQHDGKNVSPTKASIVKKTRHQLRTRA